MIKKILILLFFPTLLLAQNNFLAVDSDTATLRLLSAPNYSTIDQIGMRVSGFDINKVTGIAAIPGSDNIYAIMDLVLAVKQANNQNSNQLLSEGANKHSSGLHTSDIIQPNGGPGGRYLVMITPLGGRVDVIGQTGEDIASLSMHPNGTLYGVSGDGSNNSEELFTINTNDGSLTSVMTLGVGNDGEAIGFHPNGTLYHASGHNDTCAAGEVCFESIDLNTLTTTNIDIDSTVLVDEETQELLWSPTDNAFLWKQDHGSGPLFLVAPDASSVTQVADLNFQLKGLAATVLTGITPPIPSLSSFALLLLLLGVMLVSFQFKKSKISL